MLESSVAKRLLNSDKDGTKGMDDDLGFDILGDNDNGTPSYEFPSLGDFPLESHDEVLGILKKRPHSPAADASNKKLMCKQSWCLTNINAKTECNDSKVELFKSGGGTLQTNPTNLVDIVDMNAHQTRANSKDFVKKWSCDVCKASSFDTFEDARTHEVKCKGEKQSSELIAAGALASFASGFVTTSSSSATDTSNADTASDDAKSNSSNQSRDPSIVIDMVPMNNDTSTLSDYNNLLVRNIEFFHPSKSHLDYEHLSGSKNTSNMTDTRLGLRCIHCKNSSTHITAAAFFPSTIGSIASGLGTIGSRHFGLGKCPNASPNLVHQMVETKKSSSIQTRSNGRIGLDAYCKSIAQTYDIFDDEVSGICWVDGKKYPTIELDRSAIASVLAGMRHDANVDMKPFVPSEVNCFWECSSCRCVDIPFRARGSVVFSVEEPTYNVIEDHLKICNGSDPLAIPRNATIEPFYGAYQQNDVPPIRVKWENDKNKVKESRSTRKSEKESKIPNGVDDDPLCCDDDKQYTTEFAYFTVSQLKRCFLTKTGGSRGACPIGYAGLACGHCAGDFNERRKVFFYTTADHLRNSFSHIPSHLSSCEKCPPEVKSRLEELKKVRNRQKSLLKPGQHKIFIDRVWDRMHHGPSSVSISNTTGNQSSNHNGSSQKTTAMSSAIFSSDKKPSISSTLEVDSIPCALVRDDDRNLTSDLAFFTMLQIKPYTMLSSSDSDDDSKEIGFPGLVCSHCSRRKFFTTSSEHLSGLLLTISNHLQTCQSCPPPVRNQITYFRSTHDQQLQSISTNDHTSCMQRVWSRLTTACRQKEKKRGKPKPSENEQNICYVPVDQSKPLVTAEDKELVTSFTYFSMQQVRPCNLDKSENGSRSQFADGFPGIECKWCGDTPSARKFFYRTVDILNGNYAHIPNHLASCSRCPTEIKSALRRKKEHHLLVKHKLDKGSQRKFFNKIWDRLHACKQP